MSEVRTKMIAFIKDNFSNILGDDVKYLDKEGGLDYIRSKYDFRKYRR